LWLAGVGWFGITPYDAPGEADLEPVCNEVCRQVGCLVSPSGRLILLTHYPALLGGLFPLAGYAAGGILNCVRLLIEVLKPVAVVQGHVHEWFATSAEYEYAGGRSLIVNPGPRGAVLNIDLRTGRASCKFRVGDSP